MNWETLFNVAAKLATETSTKYGPVAWDTVLWLVRIEGIHDLLKGFICLIILVPGTFLVTRWAKKAWAEDNPALGIPALLLGFMGGPVLLIGVLDKLLNIWNWVAVFKPELYLAKQLIDKVM